MTTYRERREARAERLTEWADKRYAKADALREVTPDDMRHDWAFVSQPGHLPERSRMNARDERAYRHDLKASAMDAAARASRPN